jgi:outer membrane scaffolding protein for murein synthesis (MipA/OmpV family)
VGYPLGGGVIGSTNLTAHFADARQTQTYFGVSSDESQASGIRRYNAGGGLQNVALTQSFEFPLAPLVAADQRELDPPDGFGGGQQHCQSRWRYQPG